ncbi:MAG: C4-dicarboxylate transporter DcuC [Halanaerobiales bacterium]
MLNVLIALIVTVFVALFVYKRYKPQTVLMFGGIILMAITIIFGWGNILAPEKSTGFVWFDIFEFIKLTFADRGGGLGLLIMAIAGFAKYMDHIGASASLVNIVVKPLEKINIGPYVLLGLGYIVGQLLNILIASASGLGLLLMVTMYPIVRKMGVSKIGAAAMIGTTGCLDLGPASGNSNLAAETANMDVSLYFTNYQIPVAIAVMITIALLHYFTQKYFDKKDGYSVEATKKEFNNTDKNKDLDDNKIKKAPKIYAILPMIPLTLILVFSELLINIIDINVVTAMLIGIFISLIFEYFRLGNAKKVFDSIQIFFDGMGVQFAKVVTLIVAGQTFAQGLKVSGALDVLIQGAQNAGFGVNMMIIVMVAIISVSAIVMGSGNAPFFSFAAMVPNIAEKVGIPSVLMLLPMQFASSLARSVSPITAVIVAVSGFAEISPFDLVKRTAIPMAGGLIVTIITSFVIF